MQNPSLVDENLKNRIIEQALAGDVIGARQTIREMVDPRYQREAWIAILGIQSDRMDVEGIKETIVACTDDSLLHCISYHHLPLDVSRAGDVCGAMEIANTMGVAGEFSLMMIPCGLALEGNFVGMREAVSCIEDEATRNRILNTVDELLRQKQHKEPKDSHSLHN